MRPRFLVVGGPAEPASRLRLAARVSPLLPRAHRLHALSLFVTDETPLIAMPETGGWIIGRVFGRDGRHRRDSLASSAQLAIASSRGRSLLDTVSGSYVAVWQNPTGATLTAFRDPSAMQPALLYRADGLTLIASDLEILLMTGQVVPDIDWMRVGHYLRYTHLPTAITCISGVREILPGEIATIQASGVGYHQLWKPSSFATAAAGEAAAPEDLARLSAAIDAVVAGWASCFGQVALELSGGLDSSILAATLSRTKTPWAGITIATEAADGDERRYAKLVADRFGAPLRERVVAGASIAPLNRPTRLTVRPGGAGVLRAADQILVGEADCLGADALFSGTGGDNVFCSIASTAPILDAWSAGGAALARATLGNVATAAETTNGQVARLLLVRWLRSFLGTRRWAPKDLFLARSVRPAADQHPWLRLPGDVAAGTRAHTAVLLRIHPVLDAHDRSANRTMIFPLLSQPVLEACLSIPSWQWVAGGRDRAAVRSAFAGRLPAEILARRRKGRLESMLVQSYDRSRAGISDLLGDGLLADAGLLDLPAILQCLAQPAAGRSTDYARILELVDAELWARSIRDYRSGRPSG